MLKSAFLLSTAGLATVSAAADCSYPGGKYVNEKGAFSLSWCFPPPSDGGSDVDTIQLTYGLSGNAFVALGFGGSMYDADMISGWIGSDGQPVIGDYYSSAHESPKTDVSLGGTDDVTLVGGNASTTAAGNPFTTLTFQRKLVTGDKFDRDITLGDPNDMIYAWGSSDGEGGMKYHGDNHNHIFVDFTKDNGIPDTAFGDEESGKLSRRLIQDSYYGTLSTIQSVAAGGEGVKDFPFGSVADMVDEEPSTGRPLILLSDLERNVINMQDNPKVSMEFITGPQTTEQFEHPEYYDVMTKPRTTLLGTLEKVPEAELAHAQETYLKKHPAAKAWIGFSDFCMYRMVVDDVYVVGGFGNDHYIGWIAPEQYLSVQV